MMNVPGSRVGAPSMIANQELVDDDNLEEQIRYANDSLSKYDVKKKIGSGEFCEVFKASHRETGQTVALKHLKILQMFDAKSRLDCLREIRLLRKLDHPNIIRHIESFFANNELFIVLEYADAGDLSKMLDYFRRKQIRLSEKNVWNFFEQISAGLVYMHSQRVMHRDIKPANVLINRDGSVKLGDLGLSLLLSGTTDNAQSLVGTPYYMAPERLQEMEYNFKADIWSLGCLLYELVTLQPPFYEPNQNIQMLITKIQTLNYIPIGSDREYDDLSVEIGYIVNSCLVLRSEDRMELELIYSIAKRMNDLFRSNNCSSDPIPTLQSCNAQQCESGIFYGESPITSNNDVMKMVDTVPTNQEDHIMSSVSNSPYINNHHHHQEQNIPKSSSTTSNYHHNYPGTISNDVQQYNQSQQYPNVNYYPQNHQQYPATTTPAVSQQYDPSSMGYIQQPMPTMMMNVQQTVPIPIPTVSAAHSSATAASSIVSSSSSSSSNPFSSSASPNSGSMSIKKRMYSNIRNMF